MSPFIVHDYPKWAEVSIRVGRILGYAFATVTGLSAIIFTPNSLKPEMYGIVGSMVVFGLVCMIAALGKRFIMEWVSLFFLTAGVSTYVAAMWVGSLSNVKYIGAASIFTFLILLMAIRLIDLTVYWQKNLQAAKLSKALGYDD